MAETTKKNSALAVIAAIKEFPEGRLQAIDWLSRYGITHIHAGDPIVKSLSEANHDNNGWICSEDLIIAIAREAIFNPAEETSNG